ncbi:MAG TPA: DUF4037 domain-containing protein [Anaerolineaceae bacterium]|nr:DUF4037 domain-containing protein [Anaerolineaceae bacterium]
MPEFISGLKLSDLFYREAVSPILERNYPGLPHSAALIGFGSDVLGYDTLVSHDHMWGPRLVLFLSVEDFDNTKQVVDEVLRRELTVRFRGYSTHFSKPNPLDNGVRVSEDIESGPVEHLIEIETIPGYWQKTGMIDALREPTVTEWLIIPQQQLLEWTEGMVFHDDLGLEAIRKRFAWYPRDVWLYLLASQWAQIAEIEAFIGRTWQLGDPLGSQLVATQIVEYLIKLCFLMERRYAPYAKWLGTAFKELECYPEMKPLLAGILSASDYPQREHWLVKAYTLVAEMHNALHITPPLDVRTRTYSGWHIYNADQREIAPDDPKNTRPHQVIFAGRFVDAIRTEIRDTEVLALRPNLGSVSQFLRESCPAVQSTAFCRGLEDDLPAPE